ncbi:MAG: squalene/phytoene synthase family protein, partial [Chloroflexi bacterium]|nr:squalene/phytoene synthase family protein [Chloroflexota bacterium]
MKASIESAYARCEELTRLHAKNFAYGIRLLPPAKRRSLSAVYALARRIDDVGDGDLSQAEKLKHLGFIRNSIHNLGEESADPVLIAVRDTAERYPLPLEAFEELIKGCEMDCGVVAIQTYDELVCYCRLVAGSIGRLSLAIFGASDFAAAAPLADALGVALQMTNILRDMVEDRDQMGRIYLPREDLEIYGCSGDLSCSLDGLPELIALEA